ncbi:hypothetical protein [Pseudomonas rhizosphaerae]|nr:hypothetical protein [Pseudomonas rhizosphaerae]MBD8613067.1 hypothetical protein [Pseudomonas putida]MEB2872137.1 hypothetical protein [Pseudomonas rhizosphaerae]
MIVMDCVKYGKGLLLASLIPVMLTLLYISTLPAAIKCCAFQLSLALGTLVLLSTRLPWVRVLVVLSFMLKFAALEALDEKAGSMPLVSILYAFILL